MPAVIAALLALLAWKPLARIGIVLALGVIFVAGLGWEIGALVWLVAAAFVLVPRRRS